MDLDAIEARLMEALYRDDDLRDDVVELAAEVRRLRESGERWKVACLEASHRSADHRDEAEEALAEVRRLREAGERVRAAMRLFDEHRWPADDQAAYADGLALRAAVDALGQTGAGA